MGSPGLPHHGLGARAQPHLSLGWTRVIFTKSGSDQLIIGRRLTILHILWAGWGVGGSPTLLHMEMAKALPRINKTIFQRENFRRLTWPAFEIYYNPNNMVQTGELTRGFMQQNRPSRNRPTHIWSIEFLTKLQGEFKEEMLK